MTQTVTRDDRGHFLPSEITVNIFSFMPSPKDVLVCSLVCCHWYVSSMFTLEEDAFKTVKYGEITNDMPDGTNMIWKKFVLSRWKHFSPNNNISDWRRLFKRRLYTYVQYDTDHLNHLDYCPEMEVDCTMVYDFMVETDNPKERYCMNCHQHVYAVDTEDELESKAALGLCVAFNVKLKERRHQKVGKVMRKPCEIS